MKILFGILLIVCVVGVSITGIAVWTHEQNLNRANSIKELKYKECEEDSRWAQNKENNNQFAGLFGKNCDLIL